MFTLAVSILYQYCTVTIVTILFYKRIFFSARSFTHTVLINDFGQAVLNQYNFYYSFILFNRSGLSCVHKILTVPGIIYVFT